MLEFGGCVICTMVLEQSFIKLLKLKIYCRYMTYTGTFTSVKGSQNKMFISTL